MKHYLLFILCSISFVCYSQNTENKISYKADAMIMFFVNSRNEITLEKPFANKVNIIYDTFFKSYYITFYEEDGTYGYYQFYFVSDKENNVKRMSSDDNSMSYIYDNMENQGKLLIVNENKIDGHTACLEIIGVIRKK